jgi:hypothetical protein
MSTEATDLVRTRDQRWSVFVPLLILSATYLGWSVFHTTQLAKEREAIAAAHVSQEKPLQESKKLREKLEALARDTQLLANRGNKGAMLVVDELRKRGITINPEKTPSSGAPSTPGGASAPPTPPTSPSPAK